MKWFKSRTLWFNTIVAVLGIIELNFSVLQSYLGDHYGLAFMIIAVINVILRTITTQPIKTKE